MRLEYIQDCSESSPLLDKYAEKEPDWQKAGKPFIKALAKLDFYAHFRFNYKFLTSYYCTVQRFKFEKELYIVVTNSAINYFFKVSE